MLKHDRRYVCRNGTSYQHKSLRTAVCRWQTKHQAAMGWVCLKVATRYWHENGIACFRMLTQSDSRCKSSELDRPNEDLYGSRPEQVSAVHQQPEHQSEPSFLVSRCPPSMIALSSTTVSLQDDCGKNDAHRRGHDSFVLLGHVRR